MSESSESELGAPPQGSAFGHDLVSPGAVEPSTGTPEQLGDARYQAIIETAMDGFWWLDQSGRLLEVNSSYCRMSGYDKAELLTMYVSDLDVAESAEQVAAHMRATTQLGHERFESQHRRKDGSVFDVEISVQHQPDAEKRFVVFVRDISDRKRLESALNHRLIALTQPAVDEVSVAFTDIFDVGQIQAIQDAFSDATGVASLIAELDGRPITEPSNFRRLCGEIRASERGLALCVESDSVLSCFSPDGPSIRPCLASGLWDASANITAGGVHVANWFIGQVRGDAQDEAAVLAHAREIGVDPEEFAAAFHEVPVMSADQFARVAKALFTVAQQLSTIAYQNVQQARFITERVQARADLEDRERWLNESQRIAKLGHYVFDIAHDRWHGSPMLYEILCVDSDLERDFAGWLETVHPDDRDALAQYFAEEVLGKRSPFDKEYRISCSPDGTDRWVHGLGRLEFDASGNAISMFGVIQDITERKQHEAYRDMAKEVLQVLNQPLALRETVQAIIAILKAHTGSDAVAIRLRSGEEFPYYAQEGFADEFIASENALVSLSEDGGILRDGDKAELVCACGLVLSGKADSAHPNVTPGGSFFVNASMQLLGLSRDDDPRHAPRNRCILEGYASIALIPIRNAEGIVGLIQLNDRRRGRFNPSAVEILETIASHLGAAFTRKRAEERLGEVMVDLERSNKELEQFAYIASHDLKEPLRMVSSYTELLRKRYHGQLDQDADDFIDFAVDGAIRMQRLLEDLLAYSRVGTRGQAPAPVDSGFALDMALANLGTAIREKGAEVLRGELPMVMADESQLMRVFQNLLGNALKFCRPDEPPRIEVSSVRDGAVWRFCITDHGIGIDSAGFEQVFEVFRRMVSRDEYPGTGIGLAICRRIINRLGGAIWVESSSETGTTFCFTLPALAEL